MIEKHRLEGVSCEKDDLYQAIDAMTDVFSFSPTEFANHMFLHLFSVFAVGKRHAQWNTKQCEQTPSTEH